MNPGSIAQEIQGAGCTSDRVKKRAVGSARSIKPGSDSFKRQAYRRRGKEQEVDKEVSWSGNDCGHTEITAALRMLRYNQSNLIERCRREQRPIGRNAARRINEQQRFMAAVLFNWGQRKYAREN